jgi:hypothetical protein
VVLCFLISVFLSSVSHFFPLLAFKAQWYLYRVIQYQENLHFVLSVAWFLRYAAIFLYLLRYKHRIFVYLLLVRHVRGLIETRRQNVILMARGFRHRRGKWAMYKKTYLVDLRERDHVVDVWVDDEVIRRYLINRVLERGDIWRRAVIKRVMNLHVTWSQGNVLTNWADVGHIEVAVLRPLKLREGAVTQIS